VAARTSSSVAKARGGDARAIGNALQVDAFLDGSVRRAGDSLRVSVQLVNTSDGSTRWSNTYDGSLRDVFTVQERIARAVAAALKSNSPRRASWCRGQQPISMHINST
jgi:TolB-like protein